jgi:acyl carrier protein
MGLEAVEIVLAVEETFGIAISDSVAAEMTTPAMLIAFVQNAVNARPDHTACLSLRAFHRVRAGLIKVTGRTRTEISLNTPLNKIFSGPQRHELWRQFREQSVLPKLPDLGFGTGWLFAPITVGDLVPVAITAIADEIKAARAWSNEEVRQIVQAVISEQLGIRKFKDSDDFIRDLGI